MNYGRRCWGVLPAAGLGRRMGEDVPKQYLELAGLTVVEHSLNALLGCPAIESVVVSLNPQDPIAPTMPCFDGPRVVLATGGDERSDSVLAGLQSLAALADPQDWVLVHDAARPCVTPASIALLIERVMSAGIGGILAQPVVDTVKQATADQRVEKTLERGKLWRAQTPQMFRLGELEAALRSARDSGVAVTDEASAMERAGHDVQLVPGSPQNLKITVPADLNLAAFYLEAQAGASAT